MASINPVNSGRQSYKGFFYNPSVATQQWASNANFKICNHRLIAQIATEQPLLQ